MSSHDGTGFFISDQLQFIKRNDLNICENGNLESTFIEIVNENKRNFLCGCLYKHPKMRVTDFLDIYMIPLLEKIDKENKYCFLMGDFNA